MNARLSRHLILLQAKLVDTLNDILSVKHGLIVHYNNPKRAPIYELVRKIIKQRETLVWVNEGYQIAQAVLATQKIKGDIAEVGVYRGGTAKIISHYKGSRKLYLFDTWEGLPQPTKHRDAAIHYKGMFDTPIEEVQAYFAEDKDVFFHKGLFPKETGHTIKNVKFSYVNLDVDLYKDTLACLQFFYPRMSKGAILTSHDYSALPGVYDAFQEFFQDKPEPVIELSGSQALIVKT
jgi:O-methyltransferase